MIYLTDSEFNTLKNYVHSKFGIDLSKKRTLIEGRLSNTLTARGFDNFGDYIKVLMNDKTEVEITNLLNKITTNYTYFMREPEHFDFMRSIVLPYLVQAKQGSHDLRIWSSACSSGEEPYTMAMVIDDFLGPQKSKWDTKILASDISMNVLTKARQGIYPEESIKNLPAKWQEKYFDKLGDGNVQVTKKIRDEVIFQTINLMDPFKFKKPFDLIFCRNVMIYFDAPTKNALIDKFYQFTAPGGYLFIGHSESIDRKSSSFQYIKPAIYRKG